MSSLESQTMVPTLTMLGRFSECTRDVIAVPEVPTALVTSASMTLCSCRTPPGSEIFRIGVFGVLLGVLLGSRSGPYRRASGNGWGVVDPRGTIGACPRHPKAFLPGVLPGRPRHGRRFSVA